MIITVVNHTNGLIDDDEVQQAIRAVNRQIAEDFEPYWSFGAKLRLEGRAGRQPRRQSMGDLRGDAILYLWDRVDADGASGYHDANARGIPFGLVFPSVSQELGENWTVTLSHEALELVGDPQGNLLVKGPHPDDSRRQVFHWFEMCDAVQDEHYRIDDVPVSNFLLPLYFTPGEQEGARNDFLGTVNADGSTLRSFDVNDGGYIGFYDPRSRKSVTWDRSSRARTRARLKKRRHIGRGQLIRLAK